MRVWAAEAGLSIDCDGVLCQLLRDNVQHYLEAGKPGTRFTSIHALADRYWKLGSPPIVARKLRDELAEAWSVLRTIPTSKLAISIRSRAVMTRAHRPPPARGTVLLRLSGWKVPVHVPPDGTLEALFGPLMARLFEFCEAAGNASLVVEDSAPAQPRA